MNFDVFVQKIADLFEETEILFTPDTKFKELPEWSSLMALSVIAMIDEEYGVTINGGSIRESETIEDLYNFVKAVEN